MTHDYDSWLYNGLRLDLQKPHPTPKKCNLENALDDKDSWMMFGL